MAEIMFVRSHVARCLQDAWNVRYVIPDPDGDYPFGCDTAIGYVRVDEIYPDTVQIFAVARRSAPVLAVSGGACLKDRALSAGSVC